MSLHLNQRGLSGIAIGDVHLGLRLSAPICKTNKAHSYLAAEQRTRAECSPLAIVIGTKNNKHVLHRHYDEQAPDDYRERPNKLLT